MIDPNHPDFTNHPAHPTRKTIEAHLVSLEEAPVLTIVTPFYNTGDVFHETARSILNQTLRQWEWLIINDGSTEATALQILAEYRNRDPRIRVIDHAENRGLSAARNSGLAQARCEIVVFLDSDDLLEPTATEKWWWFLETHTDYGFVASYHVAFGGLNFLWAGGFHDGVMNAEKNRVSMMCAIRKSVAQAVGGFDETIRGGLEDWDFWMRCADHGYWGATIPEYLAWYRYRDSGDHSDRWHNLQETRLEEFRLVLKNKYPKLYDGGFPSIVEKVDYDLTTVDLEMPAFNQIRKMSTHLLVILPWLAMGGAERFTLNLIDQLTERGWEVSIITTAQSDNLWLYEFEKRTPSVFHLPNFIPIKDYPRFIGYFIQSRGIDAILLQGSQEGYRLIPALQSSFPNIPIIDYLHFVTPDWMQGGFPNLSLLYKEFIDLTFTSCEQVREWMIAAGASPERLKVCYIGVDPQRCRPDPSLRAQTRAQLGIGESEAVILYAARLEEQKQPRVVMKTLSELAMRGDKFHALIAGEGSLLNTINEEVQAHNLGETVQLLGSVPAEKMPAIMAAADIFFLPSQNEGISQALYEAMSCGLVIVSAQVGGQAELVTPQCGTLVSPTTGEDGASQYTDILHGLLHDPIQRQQMSEAGRRRVVEKFTLQQMGECMHSSICKVIEAKKNRTEQPNTFQEKQSIARETRSVVEYLQARQDLRTISQKYSTLVEPKPPSHWFYLWLRQLFLPLSERAKNNRLGQIMVSVQKWLRRILIRE